MQAPTFAKAMAGEVPPTGDAAGEWTFAWTESRCYPKSECSRSRQACPAREGRARHIHPICYASTA